MSVRLDRLQKGLYDLFAGVADAVLWAYGEPPRESLGATMLELRLLSGPTLGHRGHAQGVVILPADSVVIRVTGATVGTRNVVTLNGFDIYRDTEAGDTLTTIRDDFLTLIAEAEPSLSVSADGSDGAELVAATLGAMRRLQLSGELANDPPVFSGDAILETVATCTHVVGVQAYSRNHEPRNGAWSIINNALDLLRSHDKLAELHRFGLAVWDKGSPIDLSAIAGANWETRASVDLTVAARSVHVRPVDQIETVNATIAIGSDQISVSATAP